MNLLEALIDLYEATECMPQTKPLVRARKKVAKKIEQLQKQRARRKPPEPFDGPYEMPAMVPAYIEPPKLPKVDAHKN
jgi:hypothetical protein